MALLEVSPLRTVGFSPGMMAAICVDTAHVGLATPGSRIARLIADSRITHRRRKPGDYLFRAGDDFRLFHVLSAGFAKTSYVSEDGREQTTGLHLRGDILGLDAVAAGAYGCNAVALDGSDRVARKSKGPVLYAYSG